MEKRVMINWSVGIIVLVILSVFILGDPKIDLDDIQGNAPVVVQVPHDSTPTTVSVPNVPTEVSFETYNQDYADDESIKNELNQMLGSSGKTAFYLPATNHINVSRGTGYGVVYAFKNPNPSGSGVDWNNYNDFRFDWTVDESVEESCDVNVEDAQAWIERGQYSWGKMAYGWVDHVTVYFSFPADIEPCKVKYNFVLKRDGAVWDTKTLEFNLI
ncbi:hypothetical protein HNV12_02420 [Methanococcoides sp. SA1]|nr:hypothetical protein [Methanococcoides sp. SA1]